MTREDDRIRALLREAHREDERSGPFERFLPKEELHQAPAHALRAPALLAVLVVAAASAVAMLWPRREHAPPRDALAWNDWQGPLDFLLQLPKPPALEALPSLDAYAPVAGPPKGARP